MKQFKPYVAEFLGTMILTTVAIVSPNPFIVGITLLLIVYILGGISGAHVNPLITIALMSFKKIKTLDGVYYIIAQILGGLAAFGVFCAVNSALDVPGLTWVQNVPSFTGIGFIGELLAGFFFMIAVSTVVLGKVSSSLSGVVIGGGLGLALSLSTAFTLGATSIISNPAIAIATGRLNLDHLFAPLVGAVLGLALYSWLSSDAKSHS